jgi:hypothetical protein
MNYEVVPYHPQFADQILALTQHLWSADPALNADHLRWKHLDNPHNRDRALYLVVNGPEVVAMRAVCESMWEVPGIETPVPMACPCDLVVGPAHRGKGIVPVLMGEIFRDLEARGFDHTINLGASPITLRHSLKLGAKSAGLVGLVARRSARWRRRTAIIGAVRAMPGLWRSASYVARRLRGPHGRAFETLEDRSARSVGDLAAIRVDSEARIDAMIELVRRIGPSPGIRLVRDARFWRWRSRNPMGIRRYLYAGGEKLDGYLVLEASTSSFVDARSVTILDWEAADAQTAEHLLRAAVQWGDFDEILSWSATMPVAQRRALPALGFVTPTEEVNAKYGRGTVLLQPVRERDRAGPWKLGRLPALELNSWDLRPAYLV